jgi:hypothetical protein
MENQFFTNIINGRLDRGYASRIEQIKDSADAVRIGKMNTIFAS